MKTKIAAVLFLNILPVIMAPSVQAASATWNLTGDGNWNNNGSWTAAFPNSSSDVATLGTSISANSVITLGQDITISNLTANSAFNYTVTGANTLSIGASGITQNNSGLLQIDSNVNLSGGVGIQGSGTGAITLNGVVGGSPANVSVNYAGTLTLGGTSANTVAATLFINGGGASPNSTVVLNKTAGVNAWGGAVTLGLGAGTDTLRWDASDQLASSLQVNASGVANLNGFSDQITTLGITNGGQVTLGGGTLTVSGIAGNAGGTISGGTLAGSLASTAIGSGSAGDILTISANMSGTTNTFNKNGASTLKLQGANTATLFSLQSGVLELDSAGALASGSEFKLVGTSTFQAGTSDRSYSLGTVRLASTGATFSFSGSNNLTLTTNDVRIDLNANVDVASGRTLTMGSNSATILTSGGTATLTKLGSGTLVLNGSTATYSGLTTVTAGTLILNTSLTGATGNVTVASGATIGGAATLASGRTLTLQTATSTLTPGTDGATGNFTVNSAFSATSGAQFKFDLNGTGNANDRLATNSTLSLGTGNTFMFDFNNLNLGTLAANTSVLVWSNSSAWGTNFSGNTFQAGTLTGGLVGASFQLSGNDLLVQFTAVPEPSTLALLAIGLTSVIVLRRTARSKGGSTTQDALPARLDHA